MLNKTERDRSIQTIKTVALERLKDVEQKAVLYALDILERETETCKFNCRCRCNKENKHENL